MNKKTLIINGSPRAGGDTASLLKQLKSKLTGEVTELSAFYSHISPCVDCRGCWKTAACVIKDNMCAVYDDDFDNVVLASPIYFMDLPGPVLSLLSRFQPQYAAKYLLNKPIVLRPKKGGLILTAGGKGDATGANRHIKALFRMLNASGFEEHTVQSLHTDSLPAAEDSEAADGILRLAAWLNE